MIPYKLKKKWMDQEVALGTPMLVIYSTGYSPDAANDEFYSTIAPSEFPTSGDYAAGGIDVSSGFTVTIVAGKAVYDFPDPGEITGLTGTAKGVALIINTGNPATSPIQRAYDFAAPIVLSDGTLNLSVAAAGFMDY